MNIHKLVEKITQDVMENISVGDALNLTRAIHSAIQKNMTEFLCSQDFSIRELNTMGSRTLEYALDGAARSYAKKLIELGYYAKEVEQIHNIQIIKIRMPIIHFPQGGK